MGISVGIDIGSVATKCVVVDAGSIVGKALVKTGPDVQKSAETVFEQALTLSGISVSDVGRIVSTGYGRRLFNRADQVITEISAAAAGACLLAGGQECTILDVGGQDTKIIEVDKAGEVVDFMMNDKCAAGTGRFLEMMAAVLGTDLDGISCLALKSKKPVDINSTCSVFAESEVISLLASATPREDVAAGLFVAISSRIFNMLRQFNLNKTLVFCGGGAMSRALKDGLEKVAGCSFKVPENPQFVTAYGAAMSKVEVGFIRPV
ncbi:MAG: acyl-CoA dehydratase activase [Candidatus Omnitrophota bacterium]